MDPIQAKRIESELVGRTVGGWSVVRALGSGKSAVVFFATRGSESAAVKVFDPDLVERYGKNVQLGRIERECSLVGKSHPNLVRIYGGGECADTGYLYVTMEWIDAPSLASVLGLVPRERIGVLMRDVAAAAQYLESLSLAHRDIKPDNIAVLPDFSRAVLLDLGVLRPFGVSGLTDEEARHFIGTLQYSSPEFLFRRENDSIDGWRAVTYYQLGAVLHDLIMRRPLFAEFCDPYPVLVEAVKSEYPVIAASDVSQRLVLLAQNCLLKDPRARARLVNWSDFEALPDQPSGSDTARNRVTKRSLLMRSRAQDAPRVEDAQIIMRRVLQHLEEVVRLEFSGNEALPPLTITSRAAEVPELSVKFASSAELGLPAVLSIRLTCELLDASAPAIAVNASAMLTHIEDEVVLAHRPSRVFGGPLDSPELAVRIGDAIWSAVDAAQTLSLPEGTSYPIVLDLIMDDAV